MCSSTVKWPYVKLCRTCVSHEMFFAFRRRLELSEGGTKLYVRLEALRLLIRRLAELQAACLVYVLLSCCVQAILKYGVTDVDSLKTAMDKLKLNCEEFAQN